MERERSTVRPAISLKQASCLGTLLSPFRHEVAVEGSLAFSLERAANLMERNHYPFVAEETSREKPGAQFADATY